MLFNKKRINTLIISVLLPISMFSQVKPLQYKKIDSLIKGGFIDNTNALKLLQTKHAIDSVKSNYWTQYASAKFNIYEPTKALESIDKAILIDNTNANAYFIKAKLIAEIENNNKKSIDLLNKAIALDEKGEFYFFRGIYYQTNNELSKASFDYDKALLLNFEHEGLYRNYSILLSKLDMPEKALIYTNKSIDLNPKAPENYNNRGIIHIFLLEPKKACADFKKATLMGYNKRNGFNSTVCLQNDSLSKISLIGDVLAKMKKYKSAIKAYNKATEKEKTFKLYLNRGYCYFKINNYKKAEADYLKALTLTTSNKDKDLLFDNLSLLYFDTKNYKESIKYATKRIELNPKNHVPYIDVGLCYRKLKNYEKAEKNFNKSLEIKPDFFRAFGYRAFLFLELNQPQKAYTDASKAIEINPQYGYGYLVLAQAKRKLNITDFCLDLYYAEKFGATDAKSAIQWYCK